MFVLVQRKGSNLGLLKKATTGFERTHDTQQYFLRYFDGKHPAPVSISSGIKYLISLNDQLAG